MEEQRNIETVLDQLEGLLALESEALRALDRERLDELTAQKLDLNAALRRLTRNTSPAKSLAAQFQRIRRIALSNQLLLVHARSCVHGVLALAAGLEFENPSPVLPNQTPTVPAVRLSFRG